MKTKRLIAISLGLLLVVLSFSCKRGEEDPFLSFRSRNQRLKGWWKVKEMNIDTVFIEKDEHLSWNNPDHVEYTLTYKIVSSTNISGNTMMYEYKKYQKFENKKALFITYPDTVKFVRTFSNCEVYVCFDEDNNLTIQWNRTTPYRKEFAGGDYWPTNFLNEGDNIDTMQHETVELQPRWYTTAETGKWQWVDKKKTELDAGLFSGTVTKLSYKEVKINYYQQEALKEGTDTVYMNGNSIIHGTLSRSVSINVTLVRPDENQ